MWKSSMGKNSIHMFGKGATLNIMRREFSYNAMQKVILAWFDIATLLDWSVNLQDRALLNRKNKFEISEEEKSQLVTPDHDIEQTASNTATSQVEDTMERNGISSVPISESPETNVPSATNESAVSAANVYISV